MERTKRPEGMFSDTQLKRTKQGMQSSVDTFSANINSFMIPRLREAGYDGRLVRSDTVLACLQKKENFSTINPRYLLHDKGEGWWLEIWPKENRKHKMIVKPVVIKDLSSLRDHPRYNLPISFLKRLSMYHKNIWIRTIWSKFYDLDIHFLIMTKTGMFWMGKYSDISDGRTVSGITRQECGWELTYRQKDRHIDRIATTKKYQGSVSPFLSIKKHLRDTMLTRMYYWTLNNKYEKN